MIINYLFTSNTKAWKWKPCSPVDCWASYLA
jgi:hypothetical protein